ncbi:MAG: Dam family site-specific DNA-(adenine-N6)-methyltransferase [Candidatus Competibacteraceae bacterium]|nr:Dam family site-specific DNA-(adenine-N6)-methyltransferase [Candidatus Competibacteraceae bacterium]
MPSYLKWAGGKTKLAPQLIPRFPTTINRWVEPFFGSGAMFFAYYGQLVSDSIFGIEPPRAIAADTNPYLINTHLKVRDNLDGVAERLTALEIMHTVEPEATYNRLRDLVTKPWVDCELEKIIAASNFIYINKSCFNGLWRVNKKGGYNVPFNGSETLSLSNAAIRSCSGLMRSYLDLKLQDFEAFCNETVKEGDFVFLDPPYVPLSATSSFVSYTEDGWTTDDDKRLASTLKLIDSRGAKFLMTNSSAPLIYQYFGDWKIDTIKAPRFIKAITEENGIRDKVDETVTTNY